MLPLVVKESWETNKGLAPDLTRTLKKTDTYRTPKLRIADVRKYYIIIIDGSRSLHVY